MRRLWDINWTDVDLLRTSLGHPQDDDVFILTGDGLENIGYAWFGILTFSDFALQPSLELIWITLRAPLYDIPLYAPLYDGKVVPLHFHSFALQLHQIKFSKELLWKIICINRNKTQWIQWVWMQPSPRLGSKLHTRCNRCVSSLVM